MESVTVALVGDVYIQRAEPTTIVNDEARTLLKSANIAIGNLETPLCDRGRPLTRPFVMNEASASMRVGRSDTSPECDDRTEIGAYRSDLGAYRSDPRQLAGLTHAGFDVMSLANNHMMDYGEEGLLQTLELLDSAGIKHAGGGVDRAAAHEPVIIQMNGMQVGFLSYTSVYLQGAFEATTSRPGLATVQVDTRYQPPARILEVPGLAPIVRTEVVAEDRQRVESEIAALRSVADFVIVAWHWGISEGYRAVVHYQVDLGRLAIRAGANLVVGHHPHVLQPVELYRSGAICYSLGNFAFDLKNPLFFGQESVVAYVTFGENGMERLEFAPLWIDSDSRPMPISLDDRRAEDVSRILEAGGVTLQKNAAAGRFMVDMGRP